ncbi:MAG: hypothetical protein GX418_07520 [Clostridiales bacterium]|nr:hypothetical protein [Clostridiales bacterium]
MQQANAGRTPQNAPMNETRSNSNAPHPRWMEVEVNENGRRTVHVRLPYFLFKAGLGWARMAGEKDGNKGCAPGLEALRDLDLNALTDSIRSGETTLPCVLVDVDEPEKNQHVTVTLA